MIEKKSEDIKECGLFISIKNVTITCFIALLKEEKCRFRQGINVNCYIIR